MSRHYILNFAPTGMIPTREMTPGAPIQTDEIIAQVLEAAELGVNMVHLHARDPDTGQPTYRQEIYASIIAGIRRYRPDLILCVSTSGRNFPEYDQRSQVLDLSGDLRPDFASLTLSSLNFSNQASINEPEMITALAAHMKRNGIRPELEVFDFGMINFAKYLIQKRIIFPPFYFNLILGNIAGAQSDAAILGLLIKELPARAIWSAGGVGEAQLPMNVMGLAAGGGVRTGLEDNIWWDAERSRLAGNLEVIQRLIDIGKAMGLTPYPTRDARELLGVEQ